MKTTKKSRVTRRRERKFKDMVKRGHVVGGKERKKLLKKDGKEISRDANVWAGQAKE